MNKFQHPALKMFGKLADLKAEHDRTDIGLAPIAGAHMRVHEELHRLLHPRSISTLDGMEHEHALFDHMPMIREYVKHRSAGVTAKYAWQWANAKPADVPSGFNIDGKAFEVDGFKVTIKFDYDSDPDYSFYGEFVDQEKPGAVQNPEAWTSHGNRNHSYMAYFVPTYSEDERYADFHHRGMDKQSARLAARAGVMSDLEAAKDYTAYVVIVKAYKEGVELGSAVLGGVDGEIEEAVVEHDMISEAIEEAKQTLAKLIGSAK